jgi:hypothetical protein
MKKLRNWLETNKILFETIAAFLLSAMAIIVSIAQTVTSFRQTQLSTLQTQIAEAQALPQFEVAIHQKLNDATNKFDDDQLIINNRGGPVHDFLADAAYFINVNVGSAGANVRTIEVPIGDYFTASLVSVASTGQLVTMIGNHNNAAVADLSRNLREAAHAKGLVFANLDERLIVRMLYRDLLERPHEDYYEVRLVSGGTRVTNDVGKSSFDRWRAAHQIMLANLSPDDLLNRAIREGVVSP